MAMLGLKKVIEQTRQKKRRFRLKKKKEPIEAEDYEDDAFILNYQLDNNAKEIEKLLSEVDRLEEVHHGYKEKKDRELEELQHTVQVLMLQWQAYELECEAAEEKIKVHIEAAYAKAAASVALAQRSLELLQEKLADVIALVAEKDKILSKHQRYIAKGRNKFQDKIDHLRSDTEQVREDFEADKAFIKMCVEQCRQRFARMTEEDIERIKEETLDMGIVNLSPENWKVLAERRRLRFEVWLQADEVVSITQQLQIIVYENRIATHELKVLEQKLWKIVPMPTWPRQMTEHHQGPLLAFTSKTSLTEDLFSFEHQFRVPLSLETVFCNYPDPPTVIDLLDELEAMSTTAVKGSRKKTVTEWPVNQNMIMTTAHYPRIVRRRSSLHIQSLASQTPTDIQLLA